MNNSGLIVGAADVPGDDQHAFVYDGTTMTDIGTFGGTWSRASAINDLGTIVGTSALPDEWWHAFFHDGTGMTELGGLGGEISWALDVNDAGHVVGYADAVNGNGVDPGDERAVLWANTTAIDLNTLIAEDSGWQLNVARGINDAGLIVGQGKLDGQMRAFLLTPVPEPLTWLLFMVALCGVIRRY